MPTKVLQCPFCSKKSTRGAGLASHIRSAHPNQPLISKEKTAAKPAPKAPVPAVAKGPVPRTPAMVAASSAVESTKGAPSAGDLLAKAFAQLSEKKLAIEEELSHTEDLRKELETINLQVESLKTALEAFETSPQNSSSSSAPEETPETQAGEKLPSAKLEHEFTGNKRALVSSIVDARGSEGVTPKEIDGIFAQRKISKGRNLIYNVLSSSVQNGKMRRENGKYFAVTRSASAPKKTPRRG